MSSNREKTDTLFLLEELVDVIAHNFDQMLLSSFDISYSEWKLLLAIYLAQDNPKQEVIAAYALKTPAAVSRQLKLLDARGLVEISTSIKSKRTNEVKLSKLGKQLFNKSLLHVSKTSQILFRQLGNNAHRFKDDVISLLEYNDTQLAMKQYE